ncbi:5498_t:CDS:2 [Ambispora gerdemannii]|uniref:5498_t:CDS:1 n=1 Tax=Ambispora gerdemannii TaxID=144530 RepID=A0A9N9BDG3_9GLOM|nr:5498_t:CDS:2 [Ambispora gerdemannii]
MTRNVTRFFSAVQTIVISKVSNKEIITWIETRAIITVGSFIPDEHRKTNCQQINFSTQSEMECIRVHEKQQTLASMWRTPQKQQTNSLSTTTPPSSSSPQKQQPQQANSLASSKTPPSSSSLPQRQQQQTNTLASLTPPPPSSSQRHQQHIGNKLIGFRSYVLDG